MAIATTTATARFCPLCEQKMDVAVCAVHRVPTLDPSIFEESDARIQLGDLVAGQYKVEHVLGRGGTSAVFEAIGVRNGERVALKILRRAYVTDPVHVKRFYREALAVQALDHPNIVRTSDFGIDNRTHSPYMVMELLRGRRLDQVVKEQGPLSERRAAALCRQVSDALVHAHAMGLVHRDLKPQNIFVVTGVDGAECAKVLDFGIAKMVRSETAESEDLTQAGTRVGTPTYMSPEQIKGRALDGRSDLYSLGCILHLLLTGSPPFQAPDGLAMFLCHLNEAAPGLPARLIDGQAPSEGLRALHASLLAKLAELRPTSSELVERAFGLLSQGRRPSELLDSLERTAVVPQVFPTGVIVPSAMNLGPAQREASTVTVSDRQVALLEAEIARRQQGSAPVVASSAASPAAAAAPASAQAAPASAPNNARRSNAPWAVAAVVLLAASAGAAWWFAANRGADALAPGKAGVAAVVSGSGAASAVVVAPSPATNPAREAPLPEVAEPPPAPAAALAAAAPSAGAGAPPAAPAAAAQVPAAPPAAPISPPAPVAAAAAPPAGAVAQPPPSAPSVPVAAGGAAAQGTPAAAPEMITLQSEPPGAKVVLGGRVIGATPLELKPAAEPTRLTVRAQGYEDQEVTVSAQSPATLRVELERRRAQSPRPGGSGGNSGKPNTAAVPVW